MKYTLDISTMNTHNAQTKQLLWSYIVKKLYRYYSYSVNKLTLGNTLHRYYKKKIQ